MTSPYTLKSRTLFAGERPILSGLGGQVELLPIPGGAFLQFSAASPSDRHVFSAGAVPGLDRFSACHRYEPFWMHAAAGEQLAQVPVETQSLLVEFTDHTCALFIPLIDDRFRASLQGSPLRGSPSGGLELVVESGDPAVQTERMTSLFAAFGSDPYHLVRQAAEAVMAHLQTGRLRHDKPLPAFADLFGWCTWDAFYWEVSHDKVRQGLESFRAGGVQPPLLILDDGWQSERHLPVGSTRLTAFAANPKFPGDLAPTVRMAKDEFGVQTFLVWHAIGGYWGGVHAESLPAYGVRNVDRAYSPGILHHEPEINGGTWGTQVGVIPPEGTYRFYQDYHRHLRCQGVDGVKVDNQASIEGLSAGFGGRVAMMRSYHEAMEGSIQVHFQGNMINCMSCSSEMIYSTLSSTLTRSSTDFFPFRPESHGVHLYDNAQVSLWFGEFIHPDWDMFQSGHAVGAFHAAARAISGSPIYVSDTPEAHDFDLLRKLTLPDGKVLRPLELGRPTRDCLFHNPCKEDVLLKIFNTNPAGGVLGVFNTHGDPAAAPLHGTVSPADIPDLEGRRFAVYAQRSQGLTTLDRSDQLPVALGALDFELFTFTPIQHGFAPLGLPGMFNGGGAVRQQVFHSERDCELQVIANGPFLAWCQNAPDLVELDGGALHFNYEPASHALRLVLPQDAALHTLRFHLN